MSVTLSPTFLAYDAATGRYALDPNVLPVALDLPEGGGAQGSITWTRAGVGLVAQIATVNDGNVPTLRLISTAVRDVRDGVVRLMADGPGGATALTIKKTQGGYGAIYLRASDDNSDTGDVLLLDSDGHSSFAFA